jgi:UDP-N-acetylmuramoyl-tripeptide--D-alanyl-D-alanine ligase
MEASISFCDSVEWAGRRIYVIGAMRELGVSSEKAHARLGELLAASKADEVYLYGEETAASVYALKGRKTFFQTNDFDVLSHRLASALRPEDLLLLKGSRALALERLTERLPTFPAGDVPVGRGD